MLVDGVLQCESLICFCFLVPNLIVYMFTVLLTVNSSYCANDSLDTKTRFRCILSILKDYCEYTKVAVASSNKPVLQSSIAGSKNSGHNILVMGHDSSNCRCDLQIWAEQPSPLIHRN